MAKEAKTTSKTEEDQFSKFVYFPTQVFQTDIAKPDAMNKALLKSIYAERDKDREGISRSNIKELGGWHSHNNLHKDSLYADLVGKIRAMGMRVSEAIGYDPNWALEIGSMWSIINPPGSSNRAHVHPGCLWSGVYYVQAPENAGRISFTEPRTQQVMAQGRFPPNKARPRSAWTKVNFTPQAGRMIIFPSWLYHSVDPNVCDEKGDAANRIIISFNLSQRKI